jgi:hypothetical protein
MSYMYVSFVNDFEPIILWDRCLIGEPVTLDYDVCDSQDQIRYTPDVLYTIIDDSYWGKS